MKRFEDGSRGRGTPEDVLAFLPVRDVALDDLVVPGDVGEALRELCLRAPMGGVTALVSGPPGVGKTIAVRACAEQLRLDVWRVDCALLVRLNGADTPRRLPEVLAAGDRPHAVMLFHDAEWLFERVAGGAGDRLLSLAVRRKPPTVLESRRPLAAASVVPTPLAIAIPPPDRLAREELWRRLAWRAHPLLDLDVARLAEVEVSGAAIERALEAALDEAEGREPGTEDLLGRLRPAGL